MKFKSQVFTQVSGSVGGLTYAHNQGGLYTRARTIPVDPSTVFQLTVRNAMAQLVARWSGVLSNTQRAAWEVFATNVPVIDALGSSILISGLAWYLKANVIRRQAVATIIDTAPTIFSFADLTTPSFTVTAATDLASVSFTNTDTWATAVGGHLLTYFSRPQNQSINFFKGPYRVAATVDGAVTPPTSPASIALPFPVAVGNRVFAQFIATNADGRRSAQQRLTVVAI
ncbi:MAG: hypothetical protein ACREIS_09935 [Nitrospiraceae bacterium]